MEAGLRSVCLSDDLSCEVTECRSLFARNESSV